MLNIPHEKRYHGHIPACDAAYLALFSSPSPHTLISPIVVLVIPCDHQISRHERETNEDDNGDRSVPIADSVRKVSTRAIFCRPKCVRAGVN
jgi:hypothetical protein